MKINIILFIALLNISALNGYADFGDQVHIDSLNDLSYDMGSHNLNASYKLGLQAYKLAQEIYYKEGEITALYRIGRVFNKRGSLDSAQVYYRRAELLFSNSRIDSIYLAKVYIYQGNILRKQGKLFLAKEKYRFAIQIGQQANQSQLVSQALINLSNTYKSQGDYKNALQTLFKSLDYSKKETWDESGLIYENIGNIYHLQKRNKSALEMYRRALTQFTSSNNKYEISNVFLNLGNLYLEKEPGDSALHFYKSAITIAESGNFHYILAKAYHNMGILHKNKNELDTSQHYLLYSLQIQKSNNRISGLPSTYKALGDVLTLKKSFKESIDYYLKGLEVSNTTGEILVSKSITTKLSMAYSAVDDLKNANYYLNLSNQFQDSISSKLEESLVYELNYSDQKHQVQLLEAETAIHIAKIKRQKLMLWSTLIISVFAFLSIMIYARLNKQRKKNAEIKINHLEAEKKIDVLMAGLEQKTMNAMLNGQEKERNRIAKELHDKLGSMLSTVKLYFKSMDQQISKLKDENTEQFIKANLLLDEACEEVRDIAQELSSGVLNKFGLFSAVQSLKNDIKGSGQIVVELTTYGSEKDLRIANKMSVYRIIQELASNVLKHAHAEQLAIQLNVFDDFFNLVVEDDGIGFDVNDPRNKQGMGFKTLEARTKALNGTLAINSFPGKGTQVSIDIPLSPNNSEL